MSGSLNGSIKGELEVREAIFAGGNSIDVSRSRDVIGRGHQSLGIPSTRHFAACNNPPEGTGILPGMQIKSGLMMRARQAKIVCDAGMMRSFYRLRFIALISTLFTLFGAFHVNAHDHDEHAQDADCYLCSIMAGQNEKLLPSGDIISLQFILIKFSPNEHLAAFTASALLDRKTRDPPHSSDTC